MVKMLWVILAAVIATAKVIGPILNNIERP
jgi:hypothetical protein